MQSCPVLQLETCFLISFWSKTTLPGWTPLTNAVVIILLQTVHNLYDKAFIQAIVLQAFSPQDPLLILAETKRVAVMRGKWIDATIFLFFSDHLRRKRPFWRGTLFSSEFCLGGHYSLEGHNSLRHRIHSDTSKYSGIQC